MNGQKNPTNKELTTKISRLVEQRGWNQEEFARAAGLNRQTVFRILHSDSDKPVRNVTLTRCVRALGLTLDDLRARPLTDLMNRPAVRRISDAGPETRRRYEQATQPELLAWIERNPARTSQLTDTEMDELLSLQGTGGPLTSFGVERFAELVERKRELTKKVNAIAGTEYVDLLEQVIDLVYEKVQPYPDRK